MKRVMGCVLAGALAVSCVEDATPSRGAGPGEAGLPLGSDAGSKGRLDIALGGTLDDDLPHGDAASPDAGAAVGDAGAAVRDAGAVEQGPVNGSITIDVSTAFPSGSSTKPDDGGEVEVFLDDGQRFAATTTYNGSVTFRDPSLQGPQTVSVVQTRVRRTDGRKTVTGLTMVDVNERLAHLPRGPFALDLGLVGLLLQGPEAEGVVAGAKGGTIRVRLWAYGSSAQLANADGSYGLRLFLWPEERRERIVASEEDENGKLLRIGVSELVTVPPEPSKPGDVVPLPRTLPPITVPSITLAHPVDRQVEVVAVGGEDMADVSATLSHELPEGTLPKFLFSTDSEWVDASTLRLPTVEAAGDFSRLRRELTLKRRAPSAAGGQRTTMSLSTLVLEPNATRVEVTLPGPLRMMSPTLGTETAPTRVGKPIDVAWTTDADAAAATVILSCDDCSDSHASVYWRVHAPPARQSVRLPLSPSWGKVPAATYYLLLVAEGTRAIPSGGASALSWSSSLGGFVTLH